MRATPKIRKATRQDAGDLAILDDIASHGLANWLWYNAVIMGECDTALERGRERMALEDSLYGYRNAHIAEIGNCPAGSIIDYAMVFKGPPPSMGPVADPVMKPCFELMMSIDGHWYIDCLAVFKPQRGQGIARTLLEVADARARMNGKEFTSLITQDDNLAAISLYEKHGYKIVDRRPFVPFDNISKTREWLLLSVPVN